MDTRFRKSDKYLALNLLFWLGILYSFRGCNPGIEIKNEYYDPNKTKIRSKGEYIEGKLNGQLTAYDQYGKVIETSQWKNGWRDGKQTSFDEKGNPKAELDYRQDILLRAKWFYPSGIIQREQNYDSTGAFLIGIVDFDSIGKPEKMYPYPWKHELNKTGDSIESFIMLKNVVDLNYLKGVLIVGREAKDSLIGDTLVVVPSNSNLYRFKFSMNDQVFYDSLSFQILVCCPDHLDTATYFQETYKFLGPGRFK